MQFLRALARSTARSSPKFSPYTIRLTSRLPLLRSTWRQPTIKRASASFHTSRILREESDVNAELVEKLSSELQLENDTRDAEAYNESIKEFLENTPFELVDKAGEEEVVLKRKFGDETIEVSFSVADLANVEENPDDLEEDRALYDEEIDTPQSGGANTKGAVNQGRKPDGNIAVAPEDSLEDDSYGQNDATFPARVNVKITRDGRPGSLVIQAVAEAGDIVIENVWLFSKAEHADPKNAETEHQRRNLYTGPPFDNLDEDLKLLFERYLEERGVNMGMALFIPDYIDHKEQKEYLRWLSGIKEFVE